MAEAERFEGGCLCGAVRYRATARPLRGVICHWIAERVAWFEIEDDLPRFPRSSSAVPSKALQP